MTTRYRAAVDAQDVRAARERIRAGRYGFDAAAMLRAAVDLDRAFHRVAAAYERAGVESSARLTNLRGRSLDVAMLILSWANGDSLPRDPMLRFARLVAGVVGNAVLASVASEVARGFPLASWKRTQCPCCGASPDLLIATEKRRTLVCWRCDTMWRTARRGCFGCGEDTPPTVVRVASPYVGYELAICNACGRYIKERRSFPVNALLVERAFTADLDDAAQQRGLRV
jgi:hypothetical protein